MLTTLALATRFFCTLPGGTITEAGIHLIKSLLTFTLPDDWQWVARVGGKGEYVGTLAKRIAKYVHNNHLPKLPNDLLGAIGSAANDYTSKPSDYEFELADSFDWEPGDFSDGGVCFGPGGCRESAPGLICQQGRAIKFYRNGNKWGRAWLYPAPFGVVTFNGYGIQCVEVARVLAHYWGVGAYKKISLVNNGDTCGKIWINGGTGYAIGADVYTVDRHDMRISDRNNSYTCDNCGESCENATRINGSYYCDSCRNDIFSCCDDCGEWVDNDNCHGVGDRNVCDSCIDNYSSCSDCGEYFENDEMTKLDDGDYVCDYCLKRHYTKCDDCGNYFKYEDCTEVRSGDKICENCLENYSCCEVCGDYDKSEDMTETVDGAACEDCIDQYSECADCHEFHKMENCVVVENRTICDTCHKTNVCPICGEYVNGACARTLLHIGKQ